jgi:hypothetical protein
VCVLGGGGIVRVGYYMLQYSVSVMGAANLHVTGTGKWVPAMLQDRSRQLYAAFLLHCSPVQVDGQDMDCIPGLALGRLGLSGSLCNEH